VVGVVGIAGRSGWGQRALGTTRAGNRTVAIAQPRPATLAEKFPQDPTKVSIPLFGGGVIGGDGVIGLRRV
jgi:hypothetical protein